MSIELASQLYFCSNTRNVKSKNPALVRTYIIIPQAASPPDDREKEAPQSQIPTRGSNAEAHVKQKPPK